MIIMFDALHNAYAEIGADLHLNRFELAAEANSRLAPVFKGVLPLVCVGDIDDAVIRMVESGFAMKNYGSYRIGPVFGQETVFRPFAQLMADSFRYAHDILDIDMRRTDAIKRMDENATFAEIARRAPRAWMTRCNAFFCDTAIIGAICNWIDPLDKKPQFTRPVRKAPSASIRPVLTGPVA